VTVEQSLHEIEEADGQRLVPFLAGSGHVPNHLSYQGRNIPLDLASRALRERR
jgi:hypothetical protein